jgi:hypothetical protein
MTDHPDQERVAGEVHGNGWRPARSAPKDGTEVIFMDRYGNCSRLVHWRPSYSKRGIEFPGRWEDRGGHSTGMNDEFAWSFWTHSPMQSSFVGSFQ